MRPLRQISPLALLVMIGLLLPGAQAFGQASPFESLPQGTPEAQTQTQRTQIGSSANDDDDLAGWQAILIAGAGIALLTGVVVVIMRDARRRAPVGAGDSEAAHKPADAHRRSQAAKQKQRQKDKAAREQRRRNR